MAWSRITAGGSNTTWIVGDGSVATWSRETAGGSSTTWSRATAGGSATTWASAATSRFTFGWIPFSHVTDLWGGVDFVPMTMTQESIPSPYKASADRPIQVWDLSVITSSSFTGEARP